MELSANTQALAYLASAILFILSLKGLTHPATARRGNLYGMIGMTIAIVATLMGTEVQSYGFIIAGVVAGALIGTILAMRIQMTAMPQLVAALHSFVGMAAVLVAIGTFLNKAAADALNAVLMGELSAGIIIGAITCTGSVIAFGKLQGLISGQPVKFAGQHALNAAIALATLALGVHFAMTGSVWSLTLMTLLAFILGVTLIIPIGGADMPVIISMLNSYSGWAAAATGFTLGNKPAHHRRRPGGLLRRHPVLHHVQGHEPLHHQRGVRRLRQWRWRWRKRRSPGGGQGGQVGLGGGRGLLDGGCQQGHHHPRLWHGGGPGPAFSERAP